MATRFDLLVPLATIGGVNLPGGMVYYGKTLALKADYAWTQGAPVPRDEFEPRPVWQIAHLDAPAQNSLATASADPAAATLQAAAKAAKSNVSVALGAYHTRTAAITAAGVDGVDLAPNSATLNAPPPEGASSNRYPAASQSVRIAATLRHTLPTDLGLDLGIAWSSDNASVSVDQTGLVQVLPGAAKGNATIKATSRLDPARSANASIDVSVYGDLGVRVR
ncbi:MAG: Ig-like domain-containing protein [Candidatus Sericytochromatia bacterium]|nr:Ig-like domain-containing protein [Candidatus Tanganyikabacteria bacterium]